MDAAAFAAIAAHPGWGYGWGPGAWWPVFPLLWLVFWAALIVTAVVFWRRRREPTRSAQSLLAEEFARGRISEQEYEQRLATLRRLRES